MVHTASVITILWRCSCMMKLSLHMIHCILITYVSSWGSTSLSLKKGNYTGQSLYSDGNLDLDSSWIDHGQSKGLHMSGRGESHTLIWSLKISTMPLCYCLEIGWNNLLCHHEGSRWLLNKKKNQYREMTDPSHTVTLVCKITPNISKSLYYIHSLVTRPGAFWLHSFQAFLSAYSLEEMSVYFASLRLRSLQCWDLMRFCCLIEETIQSLSR